MTANFHDDDASTAALALSDASFHHIGIASRDLDSDERFFALFGYARERADVIDEMQGVHARFMIGAGPRLELLVDLAGRSALTDMLRKGTKMYHLAYEVDDLECAGQRLERAGAKLIVPPMPGIAFEMRRLAFWMLPTTAIVEAIERAKGDA